MYVAHLKYIYSEALSALAYVISSVITNEYMYVASVSKTKQNYLKESPADGPRTRVKPANGSRRQMTDDVDVQSLWTRLLK